MPRIVASSQFSAAVASVLTFSSGVCFEPAHPTALLFFNYGISLTRNFSYGILFLYSTRVVLLATIANKQSIEVLWILHPDYDGDEALFNSVLFVRLRIKLFYCTT